MKAVLERDGACLAESVRVADSFFPRLFGLMGRSSRSTDFALFIPGCSSIHTFLMRFKLDLLFLDADRRVMKVVLGLPAWRVMCCGGGARSVLEFREGALDGKNVGVGDIVLLSDQGAAP